MRTDERLRGIANTRVILSHHVELLPDQAVISELTPRGTVWRTDLNDAACGTEPNKIGPDNDGKRTCTSRAVESGVGYKRRFDASRIASALHPAPEFRMLNIRSWISGTKN